MFDEMVDINGKIKGKNMSDNYIDDEAWEVDSDAYSNRSVSSGDDSSSFINDETTDYETTDADDSDDDYWRTPTTSYLNFTIYLLRLP